MSVHPGPEGALPGFSRIIQRDDVPDVGLDWTMEAGEAARSILAKRFDLVSLDALSARLTVFPWKKRGLRVEGHLTAELAQTCVVSLEPVPMSVDETFTLLFSPNAVEAAKESEIEIDPLADEPPDLLPEEEVDLGEAVAEQLALSLDPYPRAPGVSLPVDAGSEATSEKKDNPFELLKNLKLDKPE